MSQISEEKHNCPAPKMRVPISYHLPPNFKGIIHEEPTPEPTPDPIVSIYCVTGMYFTFEEYVINNRKNFPDYNKRGDTYIPTIEQYRQGMKIVPIRLANLPRGSYIAPYESGATGCWR